jgi:hypothetical protein
MTIEYLEFNNKTIVEKILERQIAQPVTLVWQKWAILHVAALH